jgi:hypothetical protein
VLDRNRLSSRVPPTARLARRAHTRSCSAQQIYVYRTAPHLARKAVRRGSFDTVRALIRHIERSITEWTTHPTPFVWTKEPRTSSRKRCGALDMTSRTEH